MVSSARNPNESYADRAKKASASVTPRTTQQKHQQVATHAPSTRPSSSLRPQQVNVWAERIKGQQAHAALQPADIPRPRTTSSPQPPCDDAMQPRSPPSDLSAQLAILDRQDEHDPFVVRVPPHLSRQSSSSPNHLPATDSSAWPRLPGTLHTNASPAGYDSPFLSAAPSRQDSTASVRHHGSVPLSRVQSSFSLHSHSVSQSQSRAQSRSGSSASSPRLQIRGRTLAQDDSLPQDLRSDHQHRRSSNKRSSPALPDPPNHISTSFQIDPVSPPADPSYYQRPLVPPLQDMTRYTHNFVPQYAVPPRFPPAHVPGHTSPPYIPPHSSQGTRTYHYPPYPAYMYGQPPFFWGEIPPHSHNHFQNQPSIPVNHTNASDHAVQHKIDFNFISSAIMTESGASKLPTHIQNGSQPRHSKNVVFGTIDPEQSQDDQSVPQPNEEQGTETIVEHATEQFAAFSIGVSADEPGPSRLASRKSSVKSLSRARSAQPTPNDGAKDNISSPLLPEVNGIRKPVRWEFGTTVREDLDEPQPPSSSPTSVPSSNHQTDAADHRSDPLNVSFSHDTSQVDRSIDKSETGSSTGDVWVVKDFGYGFGDQSVYGNTPDVVHGEMREHEKERVQENHQEREIPRDQYRDKGWIPARQTGWRRENGAEERREGWEQQAHVDVPWHMRPRRGSFSGYGGHDRGRFATRRGRVFGGRFPGGRGRGFVPHHQRPGSYSHPLGPPPPHFEMAQPPIDMVIEYGPYAPPELEPYDVIPPIPQPRVPFMQAAYSANLMRNCLLGQLEYYLSPQNMAQDFYLRQRMDNQGWIPISLLASFKRVQQLYTDADTVREALCRSTVVEVSGDWVRMGGRQWEIFVLPNAPRSVVTGVESGEGKSLRASPRDDAYTEHEELDSEHGEIEGDCDGEYCEGDDEDDDVEFVIGEEAEGSWMPVPERKQ